MITDIENCYPSISIERLTGLIAARLAEERTLQLINAFLNLQAWDSDERLEAVPGLPPGPIHAHFFANAYLTEFDRLAVEHTSAYARYVDDICFVCPDENAVRDTERLLAQYLERWQQGFKSEKTVRRPVTDWEPLIDHTRKLKYARRLDVMAALDVPPEQIETTADAESLLGDLYLVVETTGDMDRLAGDAGFVVSQLKRLGAPDLDSIIYSLLEMRPLRPSTMRVLVSCLLELELPTPSERFLDHAALAVEDSGYFRINLLQVLPFFSEVGGELKGLLIDEFCRDPNYLVRGSSYVALKTLAEHGAISLSIEEVRALREAETSAYALRRLIDCYAVAEGEMVWLSLLSFLTADGLGYPISVAGALSQLLRSKRMDPAMLDSVLPSFEQLHAVSAQTCVHLLYMTSRYGAPWMVGRVLDIGGEHLGEGLTKELFSIVALEVIEELALHQELGRLLQLSEFMEVVGFTNEAMLGLEEVMGRSTDSEVRGRARVHREAVRRASVSIGLPDWYANDLDCHRGLYRETRGDSDYRCLEFQSDATQQAGTLELISVKRLRQSGFSDAGHWIAYLDRLHRDGLISLLESGRYIEGAVARVFCLYERPAGFEPLAWWLQHENVEGLLPISIILQLALSLVDAISQAEHASVRVASIDPLNVLWNPASGDVMFLNVGSSLGIPAYQCGIPGCPEPFSRDEMGPNTSTYHLGLLLLQLTKRECPITAVKSTRSRYGTTVSVSDLVDVSGMSPHMRMILVRLLQKVEDYRYGNLICLREDLSHALAFSSSMERLSCAADETALDRETLRDFIDFRLKIISRNPEFWAYPPVVRAQSMLRSLSKSLSFLPQSALSNWVPRLRVRPSSPVFPPSYRAHDLSPEGRRLVGVAQGWEEALAPAVSGRDDPTPLTKLCLYHTLAVEATSLVAAVAASAGTTATTVAQMNEAVVKLMAELRGNGRTELSIRLSERHSVAIDAAFSAGDVQQLQGFVSWIGTGRATPVGGRAESLRAVGLFLVLFGFDCELLRDNRLIARSRPVLALGTGQLAGQHLWHLVVDLAALDDEVSHFEATFANAGECCDRCYAQEWSEVWARIPQALALIRRLNPSKRWAAELYSYDYWRGGGIIRLTFPHFGEVSFRASETFSSGDLLKERDATRPVRVDIVDDAAGPGRHASSVLAPSELFRRLPLPSRALSPARTARWMRHHPRLRVLVLTTVGLGLAAVVLWYVQGLASAWGLAVPLALRGLTYFIGALLPNLAAESIRAVLATVYPEDAPLVE